jgi:hypothetical protein
VAVEVHVNPRANVFGIIGHFFSIFLLTSNSNM